ncbi:MAG: hypothetical protein N2689_12035 [Verrucomicrobiae bacterium]|nr:hypothetical protein [Verrucomicrobiae bacterium]
MNADKSFGSMRSLALLMATLLVGTGTLFAAQTGGQQSGPKGNDWDEPLGMTLGQLAIKFGTKLTPPFIAHNEREAKDFLTRHIPPIIPPGGWDRSTPVRCPWCGKSCACNAEERKRSEDGLERCLCKSCNKEYRCDIGGQQATAGDLMVILGQQLRLPVSDNLAATPAEYYQALIDTTGTTAGADQVYLSFIGLWKDLWLGVIPTVFLTENMNRPARLTPVPPPPRTRI